MTVKICKVGGVEVKINFLMKNRNIVLILVGIIVVTCGVGLLSLNYCNSKKVLDDSNAHHSQVVVMGDSLSHKLN